ncbi:MAG: LLM class flavin-dependent oxidoreductase [Deltaproteobacteria bacterium]|nr:LLM class flavin-dependent oxidoreductase [Deltaproteobacteria bacterium]
MEFWSGIGGLAKSRVFPRNLALDYAELVDSACLLEEMGFDAFSGSEHHFMYDGFCPSPLVALSGLALSTKRIKFVTGALLLPLHDPLRIAEDAATLDRLSGGRLILGLGMGYRPLEFDGLASEKRTRGARLVEMIQLVQQALSQERFSFAGKYYQYENISVTPRPRQQPHPPLWLCGGTTAKAARRAGRAGLPYWLATSTFEHAEQCVHAYREAGRAAGFPPQALKVAVFKDLCLAASREQAVKLRQTLLRAFYDEHILGYGYLVDEAGEHLYNPPRSHPLYQQFVASIFAGTPQMAIAELQRYEMLGIEAMYVATVQKELFVKEVMPAFRKP